MCVCVCVCVCPINSFSADICDVLSIHVLT